MDNKSDIENKLWIAKDFHISMDMIDMLCGDFIGEGNSRIVFDYPMKKGWVTKIVKDSNCHDNILEREMYNSVYYRPEVSKWLAPIGWMSANGRVMLQKKVTPITDKNKSLIPEHIPAFLSDIKYSNFGFIGKQLVSVDYAFSLSICGSAALNGKMQKFISHLGEN